MHVDWKGMLALQYRIQSILSSLHACIARVVAVLLCLVHALRLMVSGESLLLGVPVSRRRTVYFGAATYFVWNKSVAWCTVGKCALVCVVFPIVPGQPFQGWTQLATDPDVVIRWLLFVDRKLVPVQSYSSPFLDSAACSLRRAHPQWYCTIRPHFLDKSTSLNGSDWLVLQ